METLKETEKILLVAHKHWFAFFRVALFYLLLLILFPLLLLFSPLVARHFPFEISESFLHFLGALYVLKILFVLFLSWVDYFLDMWVISNERIIDVEQRGLFNREMSEIPLARVQDITMEIKGVIRTFLQFGTIRIQTAGEREFIIEDIPHLSEVKELILRHSPVMKAPESPFSHS